MLGDMQDIGTNWDWLCLLGEGTFCYSLDINKGGSAIWDGDWALINA